MIVSVYNEYQVRCAQNSDIHQHLPRLHKEASTGDAVIIELGVRSGNSTAAFLAALEMRGGHLHSVDIDPVTMPWAGHEQWTFHHGDDMLLAADLPDAVDIVFIDTSHHYSQTVAELEMYWRKVKPGGVILMHDTELADPAGAPAGDPAFPVRTAIDQFCERHGLVPEFVAGCYGLGVIRIPNEET